MLSQIATPCLTERHVSLLVVVMILLGDLVPISPAGAQQDKQIHGGLTANGPYSQEILNDPYVGSWMIDNLRNIFLQEVDDPTYNYFHADFIVSGKQNGSYSGYVLITSGSADEEAQNRTTWKASIIAANPDANQFDYVWDGFVSSIITSMRGRPTSSTTTSINTPATTVTYTETKISIRTTTEPLTYVWAIGATASTIVLVIALLLRRRTQNAVTRR
jgi:hypothetical protein